MEKVQVVDFVNLMTYDFAWRARASGRHHANLHPSPADPRQVRRRRRHDFLAAGVPPSKLVLGVPYGRAWRGQSRQRRFTRKKAPPTIDSCTHPRGARRTRGMVRSGRCGSGPLPGTRKKTFRLRGRGIAAPQEPPRGEKGLGGDVLGVPRRPVGALLDWSPDALRGEGDVLRLRRLALRARPRARGSPGSGEATLAARFASRVLRAGLETTLPGHEVDGRGRRPVLLHPPRYEPYRRPGDVKVPFWLQPDKHYVGPAWFERDVVVPEWKGRRSCCTRASSNSADDRVAGRQRDRLNDTLHNREYGLAPWRRAAPPHGARRQPAGRGRRPNSHSVTDYTQGN
jgi:hypothetical protein